MTCFPLERDVVVGRRRAGEGLVGLGLDLGRLAEAATAGLAAVAARPEELDGVGHDLDPGALAAVLGLPLAPLEPAVDGDGAALGEVLGAVLALRAPDLDVEVVGLLGPLAARLGLVAAGHGPPEPASRRGCGAAR